MTARRTAIVMSEVYRLANGHALPPEDAFGYLRDPKTFCHLVESSGALGDQIRRVALEKAIQKEEPDGF